MAVDISEFINTAAIGTEINLNLIVREHCLTKQLNISGILTSFQEKEEVIWYISHKEIKTESGIPEMKSEVLMSNKQFYFYILTSNGNHKQYICHKEPSEIILLINLDGNRILKTSIVIDRINSL